MSRKVTAATVVEAFIAHFDQSPAVMVRAPGRVNLIGEHTDYNDGFVLPMAINYGVWIALRPRPDRQVVHYSLDFAETKRFSLDELAPEQAGWLEYIKGTAWALQKEGYNLRGFEGILAGDVPIGAGLSSSAALEMAACRAFCVLSNVDWQPAAMARVGQRVENEWLGLQSGIMDQMISAAGVDNHALLIDCRSLATRPVPLPITPEGRPVAVVVLDTGTRRGLVNSAYNERRAQCNAAAEVLGVGTLRDADWLTFHRYADTMDPLLRRRARHVISENERTLLAVEAMEHNDAVQLGYLMNASHASLRDDYAVSSDHLNLMVELAQSQVGCYGARMTGAGFGGCAVALVDEQSVASFKATIATAYQVETNIAPDIYVCRATKGAQLLVSEFP
jgi:galactokinase